MSRVAPLLANSATFDLFTRLPAYSARTVVNAWQGCVLGALAIGVPVAMWNWPSVTFGLLHVVFTFFFLSCVALRFAAVAGGGEAPRPQSERPLPSDLPIYSVLVALYKEAEVAGDLVAALGKLDWPASKLDIKLVCEDDAETIAAIYAARPPTFMQVVESRTTGLARNPKLNYALQKCRGGVSSCCTTRRTKPHQGQLMEAWQRFQSSDAEVACLQAPLDITNGDQSWISRSFAFEYAALFHGLLPWLSATNCSCRLAAPPTISGVPPWRKLANGIRTTSRRTPTSARACCVSAIALKPYPCRRWRKRRKGHKSGCHSGRDGSKDGAKRQHAAIRSHFTGSSARNRSCSRKSFLAAWWYRQPSIRFSSEPSAGWATISPWAGH